MSTAVRARGPDLPTVLPVLRSHAEARNYYNRISRFYDFLAEWSERRARLIGLELLDVREGEKILEVGFGTGLSLVALSQAVGPQGRVFGIDIAEGMTAIAQKRLIQEGLADGVELTCRDANPLPYPDESMDGVFMSFTLELFDTPEIPQLLMECRRVLQPGGRIVVVGMSKEGEEKSALRLYEWAHEHFPRVLDCRPIFVRHALESTRFSIAAVRKSRAWVPVEVILGVKSDNSGPKQRRQS